MKNGFENFLELHQKPEPLLVGNVWNVQSARVFEQQKFKAVATSSAAVAETLGYADDQQMDIEAYLLVVRRIASSMTIPLSVDLEAGYGKSPEEISAIIARLYDMGVAGINIEDSVVMNGDRKLVRAEAFAEKLSRIVQLLAADQIKVFINVRSDSFLLGLPNALEDARSRIDVYQNTGVHGLFFPCIVNLEDIAEVTAYAKLPVNVMCMPGLPAFGRLQKAGVKRISMGPFLNQRIYHQFQKEVEKVVAQDSFDSLF
jgi:2-methylisocitrate lyase-like PEP mutase family enzyme